MNPLLLLYLLGLFDETDDDFMNPYAVPPMTDLEFAKGVLMGIGLGLGACAVAWYIVSGHIGLGPFLTF